jgi:hypothetical protein
MTLDPEEWLPIALERTAKLGDQVEVLWSLIKHTLDEDVREECEQKWFHYCCSLERGSTIPEALKAGGTYR